MPRTASDAPPFRGIPGLVWAFRFDAAGRGQALDVDAVDAAEPAAQPGWLWLHFNQGDARSAHSIQHLLELPEPGRETLLAHDTHASLALEEGVAHGALLDWRHGGVDNYSRAYARCEQDTAWLRFVLAGRLLVTSRSHALRSVEQVRRHAAAGTPFESPVALLEAVVEDFAAAVAHAALEVDNDLDRIEDRILGDNNGDERRELALLRRQAVHLYRPVASQRRMLRQFEQRNRNRDHELPAVAVQLLQRFDELDGEIVALQARARLLHEEVAAKLTEQTNRHLHALSILTALLMPPTLVVGAFGMNLDLPLVHGPHAFAGVMVLCAASSAIVYLMLRRMGVARL
ncbi:MAG: CorA family divalent cation transporter [Pseudoxanthomonas sp.]